MRAGAWIRAVSIALMTAVVGLALTVTVMSVYSFATATSVSLAQVYGIQFTDDGSFGISLRIDRLGIALLIATAVLTPAWYLLLRRGRQP